MSRILMPLAAGYRMGVALRQAAYRRGWLKARRLGRPVLSVGNLTAGGTGKTPLVAFMADLLVKRGWKPSILTRGYGRRDPSEMIAVEPVLERAPSPREIGDEPALLAGKLPQVPIVVGADRYQAGSLAEERFNVDVHILDDGFQHLALERDADIVLLDVTQGLSDASLVPAGRLREPLNALERAHMIILSRVELADPDPTEKLARYFNPRAKVYRCRTRLLELVDVRSGRIYPPTAFEGEPVYAFCGIGNPKAFFANIRKWGFRLAGQESSRDHHAYRQRELALIVLMALRVSSGIKAILTTEKDAQNLAHLKMGEGGIPILACVIRAEILETEAFEAELFERLQLARVRV